MEKCIQHARCKHPSISNPTNHHACPTPARTDQNTSQRDRSSQCDLAFAFTEPGVVIHGTNNRSNRRRAGERARAWARVNEIGSEHGRVLEHDMGRG
jgi:hypothetical protein